MPASNAVSTNCATTASYVSVNLLAAWVAVLTLITCAACPSLRAAKQNAVGAATIDATNWASIATLAAGFIETTALALAPPTARVKIPNLSPAIAPAVVDLSNVGLPYTT